MKRGLKSRQRRRISIGLAPLLAPYHLDVNPRGAPHCPCCVEQWKPADCPVKHTLPCPECAEGAA